MNLSDRCMGCMELKENNIKCPHCGWVEGAEPESNMYLMPGTILLEKYIIGRVLGQGGFGITYLAWDMSLSIKLAIKEYLPRELVFRSVGQNEVNIYKGTLRENFSYGLERFLEEARILARFNEHPNIVSVRDYFRANGTAYLVMNYIEGVTLEELMSDHRHGLSFEQAIGIMMPVMDALKELHKLDLLHRDISPDNIFINKNGQVVLIDFGAARQAVSAKSQGLSVVVKPGYAPEEQYRNKGIQGPWTDIYAIAATIYHMITGRLPAESLDRLVEDTIVPPSQFGVNIEQYQERALLKALAVRSADRYQAMSDFQEDLLGKKPADTFNVAVLNNPLSEDLQEHRPFTAEYGGENAQFNPTTDDHSQTEHFKSKVSVFPGGHAIVAGLVLFLMAIIIIGFMALDRQQIGSPPVEQNALPGSDSTSQDLSKHDDWPPQGGSSVEDTDVPEALPGSDESQQAVISVPGDFSTIQEALDSAVSGMTITVQPGVYYENIDFKGKSVKLQSTDPNNYEVVRSTVIDGNKNGSVVSFKSGEGSGAAISGFTIRGGSGTREKFNVVYAGTPQSYDRVYGGGIIVANQSSPHIYKNIIENNTADIAARDVFGVGGGIAVLNHSSPLIEDNIIRGNNAEGYAGGVAIWYNSSPQLINNFIEDNSADDIAGGVLVAMDCSPLLRSNTIENNSSRSSGGIYIAHGSSGNYVDNIISANNSNIGAGILVWRADNVTIKNNIIEKNRAQYYGGGLYVGNRASLTVTGNSFNNNSARESGGAVWVANDSTANNSLPDENIYMNNTPDNIDYSQKAGPSNLPWP